MASFFFAQRSVYMYNIPVRPLLHISGTADLYRLHKYVILLGVTLQWSVEVLIGIFNSSITEWNHPLITQLNPFVLLPSRPLAFVLTYGFKFSCGFLSCHFRRRGVTQQEREGECAFPLFEYYPEFNPTFAYHSPPLLFLLVT